MTVAQPSASPLADPCPFDAPAPRVPRPVLLLAALVVTLAYALLWSPHWYPLSDSSLYLSLARAVAAGRGYTYMGGPHRLVPPATPLLLALVMKLGGGIGAMQALLTALMLAAHALCFCTVRRWVDERLALAATLATALSYWVFINAFTIMSEPLGLSLYWAGLYALTRAAQSPRPRWFTVLPALALLVCATESRIATLGTVPGLLAALWLTTRRTAPARTRLTWAVLFTVTFAIAFFAYRHPARLYAALGLATRDVAATRPSLKLELDADNTGNVREGTYAPKFLQDVPRNWHLLTDPPVLAGRWICEGLAMPTVVLFTGQVLWVRIVGVITALAVAATFAWGCCQLLRRRQWWVLLPLTYFLIPWLQWGARLKPRYMAPITPMLFIALCLGIQDALRRLRRPRATLPTRVSRPTLALILLPLLIANAVAWATEFAVRHRSPLDFYDVARRGAYADLVDIGAYLQFTAHGRDPVWLNEAAARRIVYFLCGRRTEVPTVPFRGGFRLAEIVIPPWHDLNAEPTDEDPAARDALRQYFARIPRTDRWAIVYTAPEPWPDFHLPLRKSVKPPEAGYFRLYHRRPNGSFHRVDVPPANRTYVTRIPPAAL